MYKAAVSLLALSGAGSALKLHQVRATAVHNYYHADGWTPKPTSKPKPMMELFRRQTEPEFCGYLTGDADQAVTCDFGSSCMYDDVFSWFGCCTGTAIPDCDVQTACVRSESFSACLSDSLCANDPLAMACTRKSAPFCAALVTVVSGQSYGHFVCDSTSTTYQVLTTATDGRSGSFSLATESTAVESASSTRRSRFSQATVSDVVTPPPFTLSSRTTASPSSGSQAEPSSAGTSSPAATTQPPGSTQGPVVASPSSTASNAAAMATAEAVAGVAGLLALLL